ncbi:MAG: dephospho-CoA kinase [Chloroflexi bacterium]|nr:dephospho-CoA kinase [Chloroflexota bacterium]
MLVIGLTGGIGSGKSEVSKQLQELGAEVIDADKVGHQAYIPHSETWKAVVAAFGNDILQPNGEIDRRKLGAIVFSDPSELARLNSIMHPRMAKMIGEQLEVMRARGVQVGVLEAAILIEANWTSQVDEVWVVAAPEDVVVRRVKERNNLPEEEVRRRIRAQLSNEERAKHAAVVIENDGGLEALHERVQTLWNHRVQGRVA